MARAVLAGPPRQRERARTDYDEALGALGLTDAQAGDFVQRTADAPSEGAEVWPDQQTTVSLFCALLTQWRMGSAGPIGLDYGVLPTVERRLGLTPEQADAAFAGLQVMEDEALCWLAAQRDKATHR